MIPVHQCEDISDTLPLFPVKGLFFKPISRIHVSVHYPQLKQSLSLPTGGKTVSSWEIMEKLKALLAPDKFISIRVVKNTLEFIRFEGDLENRSVMKAIMGRLEGKSLKITGFKEPMKVRVAEAKVPFPSKYDWDTFFRDAKNMNEMKAGERPDTIHLQNLPCKWFSDRPLDEKPIPSEKLFRRIWETFGDVRAIDIPLADPYRTQMQSSIAGIKTFTFSSDAVFEAYVQYKDYMSFVRAMDALRGSYILHQENNKYWVANVKVDFDKSKHLGDESIRKRRIERERLIEKEKQEKITATLSKLEANEKSRKDIEEKKKETDKNQAKLDYKIAMEERKYIIARRKLEAIRLMDYLFERLKKKMKDSKRLRHKDADVGSELHEKIMGKYKKLQQAKVEEQHKKLKKFHKSRRRESNSVHESGDERYPDEMDAMKERRRSASRSRSPSRSRSRGRSRSGSRFSNRMRSRSRSRSREVDRSRSRGGSRSRSRERSRSRTRSRSRSRGRSRSLDKYKKDDFHNHPNGRYHNRGGANYYRGNDFRHYESKREYDDGRDYVRDDRRNDHHYENDRYPGKDHDNQYQGRERDYPFPSRPPRGHFHRGRGDGPAPPFRGRGRGSFPSRYIGDWELRDREKYGPMPPHPSEGHRPPPEFHRGRGRGGFRGRGRGFHHDSHPHPHHNNHYDKYQRYDNNNGPVVHRDFTYLEELDRAYEKYFKSITSKNERSGDEDRSPDH